MSEIFFFGFFKEIYFPINENYVLPIPLKSMNILQNPLRIIIRILEA